MCQVQPYPCSIGPYGHVSGPGHRGCGCRECRKEARDLLVEANSTRTKISENPALGTAFARMSILSAFADASESSGSANADNPPLLSSDAIGKGPLGMGAAFVGGGCCVHLSIEYAPSGTADGTVAVAVRDSQDTEMLWLKKVPAALGYQIKEGIVTTKPGANLTVMTVAATARVRWCEVFSCC